MDGFRQLAREKFPYGRITGTGRFAVCRKCPQGFSHRWRISLHATDELATRACDRECTNGCLGCWNHFVVILGPDPDAPKRQPQQTKPTEPPPPLFAGVER